MVATWYLTWDKAVALIWETQPLSSRFCHSFYLTVSMLLITWPTSACLKRRELQVMRRMCETFYIYWVGSGSISSTLIEILSVGLLPVQFVYQ
jgi:hypothetical protein